MRRQDVPVLDGCVAVVLHVPNHIADLFDGNGRFSLLLASGVHSTLDLNDKVSPELQIKFNSVVNINSDYLR